MATLSGLTSARTETCWEKYVVADNKWRRVRYELDREWQGIPAGTSLAILDPTVATFGKVQYAATSLGGVPLCYIRKPHARATDPGDLVPSEKLHGLLYGLDPDAYTLNAPSVSEVGERHVLQSINGTIAAHGRPVTLQIGRTRLPNIVGANKVAGTPKGDIALVAEDRGELREVYWFSHKAGNAARHFQQYASCTEKAGETIAHHADVLSFLGDLREEAYTVTVMKRRLIEDVMCPVLLKHAIYGPDPYPNFSAENINSIGQGDAIMERSRGGFRLGFSAGLHENPDVGWAFVGEYRAVLGARYTAGRGITIPFSKTRIENVRVMIAPVGTFKRGA